MRERSKLCPVPVRKLQRVIDTDDEPEDGTFRHRVRVVLVELHLVGNDIDPNLTVVICHNCHEQLHAQLRDY